MQALLPSLQTGGVEYFPSLEAPEEFFLEVDRTRWRRSECRCRQQEVGTSANSRYVSPVSDFQSSRFAITVPPSGRLK